MFVFGSDVSVDTVNLKEITKKRAKLNSWSVFFQYYFLLKNMLIMMKKKNIFAQLKRKNISYN